MSAILFAPIKPWTCICGARNTRRERRLEARRTTWMVQSEARLALRVGRDDMRLLLEIAVVRGKRENGLWLAERAHVECLARDRRALIGAVDRALEALR